MARPTIMRFSLKAPNDPRQLWNLFLPQGKTVLNRTSWRGKEPRSCGIMRMHVHSRLVDGGETAVAEIEVAYRPPGYINYIGGTKYDGWTALVPIRDRDGTFRDEQGGPLPDGHSPQIRRFEVYADVEFNDIDFGELVEESPVHDETFADWQSVFKDILATGESFGISMVSKFTAPRRNRPPVKLVIAPVKSGITVDRFGMRVTVIDSSTPKLAEVLLDEVTELVSGFIEGRYSLNTTTSGAMTLVDLSSLLVDQRPTANGGEPLFDCLDQFVSREWLLELSKRITATYQATATPVVGEKVGLLLKLEDSDQM
jgi:hypothetical protein